MESASHLVEAYTEQLAEDRAARINRDGMLRRMLGAGDALAVLLALALALLIPGRAQAGDRVLWGLIAIPLFGILFKLYGLYDRDVKRISHSTVDELSGVIHAAVIGSLMLWLYSKYSALHQLVFIEIALFGVGLVALVLAMRVAMRAAASRLIGRERALLVGGGTLAQALVHKLATHREYGLEVVGSVPIHTDQGIDGVLANGIFVPPAREPRAAEAGDVAVAFRRFSTKRPFVPVLGALDDLDEITLSHGISRVILSTRGVNDHDLERLLRHCRRLALKVSVLPTLSDMLGPTVEIEDVAGITVLGLSSPSLSRSSRVLKRTADLVIASGLLVLLFPVMLASAITIKLGSRGPVFFKQERIGRRGRHFHLFKFRTMVPGADQRHIELLQFSTDPHWLKLDNDPRITGIGRALRRFSVDELPQLWNVVRGEMSIVGPRPLIPVEDELVQDWGRKRLDLTPGMTGYWQVLGRSRIPFEEMVKLDYLYAMNWSLWQDVRLILKTVPVVLAGRGAQ